MSAQRKKKRILVLGSGGREHALCWKIGASPVVEKVFCAPGNAGTALEATTENVDLSIGDFERVLSFIHQKDIDLVVVGPEQPLVDGLVDVIEDSGKLAFGPSKSASRLEGSKSFAKNFMKMHQVPTANFRVAGSYDRAMAHLDHFDGPLVVKADGLAAGKGVLICSDRMEAEQAIRELFLEQRFGTAGQTVVIEQFIVGEEVSVLGLCSGTSVELFVPSRDHKRLLDGNQGPNTGGMGAFAPVLELPDDFLEQVRKDVFVPTLEGLKQEGAPFYGVLYAGLILNQYEDNRPYVLEFNVRFGDPETQALLYLLESDLVPALFDVAQKRRLNRPLKFRSGSSLCVVVASDGYPGSYKKNIPIGKFSDFVSSSSSDGNCPKVFHAGTRLDHEAQTVLSSGGRVLGLTSRGSDLSAARQDVYKNMDRFNRGFVYRQDIGQKV